MENNPKFKEKKSHDNIINTTYMGDNEFEEEEVEEKEIKPKANLKKINYKLDERSIVFKPLKVNENPYMEIYDEKIV